MGYRKADLMDEEALDCLAKLRERKKGIEYAEQLLAALGNGCGTFFKSDKNNRKSVVLAVTMLRAMYNEEG